VEVRFPRSETDDRPSHAIALVNLLENAAHQPPLLRQRSIRRQSLGRNPFLGEIVDDCCAHRSDERLRLVLLKIRMKWQRGGRSLGLDAVWSQLEILDIDDGGA